jgi:3-phenylpropionate/trans-cinnamate dioxygenase ferredoxin reductase subunit
LEHFDNAQLQGAAAADSMCGKTTPYDPIPFFWSDQYDWGLQYYGSAKEWDDVVLRGHPAQDSFMAFYLKGGRIEAVCGVNRSRDTSNAKRLLGQINVPVENLANDDFSLANVAVAETSRSPVDRVMNASKRPGINATALMRWR